MKVVCPSGFTNVKASNNQLGCMQTAEEGSITSWWDANNDCFTTYGGRLPKSDEWFIAMNNFALTDETDDFEWTSDKKYRCSCSCMWKW